MNTKANHFWLLSVALQVTWCWCNPVAGQILPQSPARLGRGILKSLAYAPDGSVLAAFGDWGIWLYDPATLQVQELLEGRIKGVLCGEGSSTIAVNPDGRTLAIGGDEGVLLWDREKHRRVATLDGHTNCIGAVAFSPDGRLLASGSNDLTVRLWDMETRTQRAVLSGHTGRVTAVAFSPDGRTIASGGSQGGGAWDGTVRLWSAEDGQALGVLEVGDPVYTLNFSPDGHRIAAAGLNAIVHLWDLAQGREVRRLAGHTAYITAVAFSPDGEHLISGSNDGTVRRWNTESGAEEQVLTLGQVRSLALRPDGETLAWHNGSGTLGLWDMEHRREQARTDEHLWGINVLALSPDGQKLALAPNSGLHEVQIWELKTRSRQWLLSGHQREVKALAFSPDGRLLASGGDAVERLVYIWDLETGLQQRVLERLGGVRGPVAALEFSLDSKHLLARYGDGTLVVSDPAQEAPEAVLEGYFNLVFSPDGHTIARIAADGALDLWQLGEGQGRLIAQGEGRAPDEHFAPVVEFSPDGEKLAWVTQGSDQIHLWEVTQFRELAVFQEPAGPVKAVAFSPNGRSLAWSSWDGKVSLWGEELEQRQELALVEPVGVPLVPVEWSLRFSVDGVLLLISASWSTADNLNDGTVWLWDLRQRRETGALRGPATARFAADGQFIGLKQERDSVLLWGEVPVEDIPTAVSADATRFRPAQARLSPNFPNPFNVRTQIPYELSGFASVKLRVYNLAGHIVCHLVDESQPAGHHQVVWDGRDEQGRELASGVYFYRLQAGAQVETRKLLLLR